jgi:hypothetical protein
MKTGKKRTIYLKFMQKATHGARSMIASTKMQHRDRLASIGPKSSFTGGKKLNTV